MAEDADNPFQDILSAALDESGITGDFDYDETAYSSGAATQVNSYIEHDQPIAVQNVGLWNGKPVVSSAGVHPVAQKAPVQFQQVVVNTNENNTSQKVVVPQITQSVNNDIIRLVTGQAASTAAIVKSPSASNIIQIAKTSGTPGSVSTFHAVQSSPALSSQAASGASTTPRIIKITRLGGQGGIKLANAQGTPISIGSLASGSLAGKKIIIKRASSSSSLSGSSPQVVSVVNSNQNNGRASPLVTHTVSADASLRVNSPVQLTVSTNSLESSVVRSNSPVTKVAIAGGNSSSPLVLDSGQAPAALSVINSRQITTPQGVQRISLNAAQQILQRVTMSQPLIPSQSSIQTVNVSNVRGTSIIPTTVLDSQKLKPVSLLQNFNDNTANIPLTVNMASEGHRERNVILTGQPGSITNIKTNLSSKDLSRLWANDDVKLKRVTSSLANSKGVGPGQFLQDLSKPTIMDEEEVIEETEELGVAETYSEYMPSKLRLGIKHPDPVVETSSLSSVESPDIWYKLSIPENTIDYGDLSALQLETIVYASQRHNIMLDAGERAGFLIGDGAGVGKGRTIAGIIYENYLLGRKRALWLSVSSDLRVDAERDLKDIGAGRIEVHPLNKFRYAKISSKENGSVKKGVIFATYSSLIGESHAEGKYKTRLKQLLKWCGKDFDGVIVFDECHKAKNLCPVGSSKPTKTGQTVLELQNRLPKARVVYASATGASEPKNMAYMTRLGLWGKGTPFPEFNDFIQAVERRGVGAMELVAMDMKLRGMYIARQLSFKGVTFKIEEIPLEPDFEKVYNKSVHLWVTARERFQRAAELMDAENRMKKTMWGQFWSAHQRFFKYLCISAKVHHCVSLAREAVKNGKCVVIGLQSTGEARTLEQLEEMGGELNDFVSTAKGVFQTLVEKHFPAPDRKKTFDMFGVGSLFAESKNAAKNSKKRKKEQKGQKNPKKAKKENSENSSDSDSDWLKSDSDKSANSDSDQNSFNSDDDADDFNPFGNSDSDDDPWLTKKKGKSKKKKQKKKKSKKTKKSKSDEEDDDEDDDDNMDEMFDRALAAAGLLKSNLSSLKNDKKVNGNASTQQTETNHTPVLGVDGVERAIAMKRELLDMLEEVGDSLPPNTLDHLIDELGGPENVAEMTGRKGRVVSTDEGIAYESRKESDVSLEMLNLTEKQRFMDGEKDIAIISEAASSGISLQSDRRAINQKRRVHITLELPWSADRAIQQFGRTHRSNQVSAPEYIFMISELAGEQRFASTVAKRLESLGALTHGDRRATETRDLSRFNIDNKYGRASLESVMKSIMGYESPLVRTPESLGDTCNFFEAVRKGLVGVGLVSIDERINIPVLDKDYNNISKFLNRILGMEVALQNALFKYFSESLMSIILDAKRSGRWDMGILDLGSGEESVKKIETMCFIGNTATNTAKTELTKFMVERGMSWSAAMDMWRKYTGIDDGFYVSLQERSEKRVAVLAVYCGRNKKKEPMYNIYRPNTGRQSHTESIEEIKKKYKKALPDNAQQLWENQYDLSAKICSHAFWRGNCKKVSLGLPCEIGLRCRTVHVLSGSVLSVWSKVESVLASMPGGSMSRMQIIRLKTDSGERIVGSLIPNNCVKALSSILSQDCKQTFTEREPEKQMEEESHHLSMPMFF